MTLGKLLWRKNKGKGGFVGFGVDFTQEASAEVKGSLASATLAPSVGQDTGFDFL